MRPINNHAKSRQLNNLRFFAKTVLSVLVVFVLQLNVYAGENPTAALNAHLREMKLHMIQMHEMTATGTGCREIDRHVTQMTVHMEMMDGSLTMMKNAKLWRHDQCKTK